MQVEQPRFDKRCRKFEIAAARPALLASAGMGSFVSFVRVTDDDLDRAEDDPDFTRSLLAGGVDVDGAAVPRVHYALDPHAALQFLLDAVGLGVCVTWPDAPGVLIDLIIEEDECVFAMASDDVAAMAQDLSDTSFDQLAVHFDKTAMAQCGQNPSDWSDWDTDEALDFLKKTYAELVAFLVAAAEAESAMLLAPIID